MASPEDVQGTSTGSGFSSINDASAAQHAEAGSSFPSSSQADSSTSSSSNSSSSEATAGAAAGAAGSSEPGKKKPKIWQPLSIASPVQIMQEDIMNNCFIKAGISGAMGGVAGLAFGIFSASLDNAGAGPMGDMSPVQQDKPTRVVLKEMLVNMRDKSSSYAKGFAQFGALYAFNECVIEKFRAKHDKVNPALAGCATGAMMAYGAGPQAMCFGCLSVGAFSVAIEHFLDL